MYVIIRWWMICSYHRLRRSLESRTLSKKYLMSYHNRRENMMMMVYESDVTSIVNIRMNIDAFSTLCDILENRGGLKSSKNMLVDEQVAMFLHTLAHNVKNMVLVNRFHRSGETISWYFKLVLHAVCRLHKEFYKSPVPVPDNETDERWKWFKGCLGALDGTYVKVKVPAVDRKPYRTRKGEICTNVLGVYTRDLLFTYVLAGWEGSAADSRVLRDAVSRPNGLKITQGTYYLCDAGYTNGEGFLTPYRGQRYHLNDWSRLPTNAEELFNMRHSSARNVIERCFRLIKDMADSNVAKGTGRSKHTWTTEEDTSLINALMELHASGKYAGADNGFKPGYLNGVQQLLDVSLPNSGLKVEPHLKSRMKTWKTHFSIVYDMVHTSGFGWDEEKNCVVAEDSVWDEYVKSHKGAANFRGKPFPFYDKLCTIFGKDRATGNKAIDLRDEDEVMEETQKSSPLDDFGFDEEPAEGACRSDAPTSSVTSKRKRRKSVDGDEIYRESCKEMKEVLAKFGEIVGEGLNKQSLEARKQVLEAREIFEKVSDELKVLPRITGVKRFKATQLIGKDVLLGRLFLGLAEDEKIEMVESSTNG
ncbi:hypothetical protein OSB04_006941 [Centaurea solstitialis]|uniref:Transposase n=1 Tax=Centaurea solstitialis TaxID=347529 RepID=A0AA38TWR5_9ASTR|nr:hypothetical protein OSB04_006941 [Centaurea solstitialis]